MPSRALYILGGTQSALCSRCACVFQGGPVPESNSLPHADGPGVFVTCAAYGIATR